MATDPQLKNQRIKNKLRNSPNLKQKSIHPKHIIGIKNSQIAKRNRLK